MVLFSPRKEVQAPTGGGMKGEVFLLVQQQNRQNKIRRWSWWFPAGKGAFFGFYRGVIVHLHHRSVLRRDFLGTFQKTTWFLSEGVCSFYFESAGNSRHLDAATKRKQGSNMMQQRSTLRNWKKSCDPLQKLSRDRRSTSSWSKRRRTKARHR